jgi:hypothetical protein
LNSRVNRLREIDIGHLLSGNVHLNTQNLCLMQGVHSSLGLNP